jgi:hypothetical protein
VSEAERVFLDHLERRRGELAVAQWQAPTLTIAAQAFLLQVLTDEEAAARGWILAAGIAACIAAMVALLRLRQREILYSDAIAHYGGGLGMADPRPSELHRRPLRRRGPAAWLDRKAGTLAGWKYWPDLYWFWIVTLCLFIVADVFAYRDTP